MAGFPEIAVTERNIALPEMLAHTLAQRCHFTPDHGLIGGGESETDLSKEMQSLR